MSKGYIRKAPSTKSMAYSIKQTFKKDIHRGKITELLSYCIMVCQQLMDVLARKNCVDSTVQ